MATFEVKFIKNQLNTQSPYLRSIPLGSKIESQYQHNGRYIFLKAFKKLVGCG